MSPLSDPQAALDVLYQGPELLALAKPSGIPSVPLRENETGSALQRALVHHPELAAIPGRQPHQPALLHRLDTATSGVLLFARTASAFEKTLKHWDEIDKRYRAWVSPSNKAIDTPSPRVITTPLAHAAKSAKRMIAVTPHTHSNLLKGRPLPALTEILAVHARKEALFDLEVSIQRGVMHQIRAHLAHRGWPVAGDPIYRGVPSERLQLHAWKVHLPWIEAAQGGLWIEAPLPVGWT